MRQREAGRDERWSDAVGAGEDGDEGRGHDARAMTPAMVVSSSRLDQGGAVRWKTSLSWGPVRLSLSPAVFPTLTQREIEEIEATPKR